MPDIDVVGMGVALSVRIAPGTAVRVMPIVEIAELSTSDGVQGFFGVVVGYELHACCWLLMLERLVQLLCRSGRRPVEARSSVTVPSPPLLSISKGRSLPRTQRVTTIYIQHSIYQAKLRQNEAYLPRAFAFALFASQALACVNQGDSCGAAELGNKVCGCADVNNLVSRTAAICCHVLMCVSFNASKKLVGHTIISSSRSARMDVSTKSARKRTCCDG